MDYTSFEKHILFLKQQKVLCEETESRFSESGIDMLLERSMRQHIELLEMLMGVEKTDSGYSTLSWWIEKQNFGKKKGFPTICDKISCGNAFDFSTVRGLYDFLTVEADWSFRQKLLMELKEQPVTVEDVEEGLTVSMSHKLYMGLTKILLESSNMTLEESLYSFITWCVEHPESFAEWIQSYKCNNSEEFFHEDLVERIADR